MLFVSAIHALDPLDDSLASELDTSVARADAADDDATVTSATVKHDRHAHRDAKPVRSRIARADASPRDTGRASVNSATAPASLPSASPDVVPLRI
jgi:hypothetical protein